MKSLKEKKNQINMGLDYNDRNLFQRISNFFSKLSTLLDQFLFWRTPMLWFDIFINVAASIFATTWIYSNYKNLPEEVALWYYFFDQPKRFVSLTDIINLIFIHLFIQSVTILIAYKVSSKFKQLANFLLLCICITSIMFYLAIYKSLSLVAI